MTCVIKLYKFCFRYSGRQKVVATGYLTGPDTMTLTMTKTKTMTLRLYDSYDL